MKIINYDVDKDTALMFLSFEPFVLDVVRHLEVQLLDPVEMAECHPEMYNAPVRFLNKPRYENVASLIHTIPIYLCESHKLTDGVKMAGGGDVLGAYCFDVRYNPFESPFIVLYAKNIIDAANDYMDEYGERVYKWLFTKVLLHELGHAAMDIRNFYQYYYKDEVIDSCNEGKKIEESMANAIALRTISGYDGCKDHEEFFEYVKAQVQDQDEDYKKGANIYNKFTNNDIEEYVIGKVNGLEDEIMQKWIEEIENR